MIKRCSLSLPPFGYGDGGDGIVARFDFPESNQIPGEQYLLYFSQCLRDIGITAKTSVVEEAGSVLFSVIPTDRTEALSILQEALEIYLALPSSPLVKSSDSFAIRRLEYQIEALHFQVRSHQRELRMAGREIEHQDLLLNEANDLLRRYQRNASVGTLEGESKPSEGGKKMIRLTTVKKLEDYGVSLDLGEVFRRLSKNADDEG